MQGKEVRHINQNRILQRKDSEFGMCRRDNYDCLLGYMQWNTQLPEHWGSLSFPAEEMQWPD